MCFVEPIAPLYAIHYSNMFVYSLFAKLILLDAIYFRSCFYSIIRTLDRVPFKVPTLKSSVLQSKTKLKLVYNNWYTRLLCTLLQDLL